MQFKMIAAATAKTRRRGGRSGNGRECSRSGRSVTGKCRIGSVRSAVTFLRVRILASHRLIGVNDRSSRHPGSEDKGESQNCDDLFHRRPPNVLAAVAAAIG
jgi:hypothetical protein